jgi:hypothetical protein
MHGQQNTKIFLFSVKITQKQKFTLLFGAMFTLATKVSNSITYSMQHSPS